jgi:hypothetical protein
MNGKPKSKNVIICDSSSKLEQIHEIIDKFNPIIITFDKESHDFLLEEKITHELSDDYLNDVDLDNIQDLTYQFSNWYNKSEVSDLNEFDGLKIGELFYLEFSYYLSPILKKFFEIQKIHQKFENSFFISSSSLTDFLKLFSSNVEELSNNDKKNSVIRNNNASINFDTFSVFKNSGNKVLKNLIKSFYLFYKKFFSSNMLNPKNPTTLLINFTTLRLEKFFEELPNHSINLVKYDTIAPAFWNFETLSIIKKSKCFIENNETIHEKNSFSSLKNHKLLMQQKSDLLLEKKSFFENFFSHDTHSFWNIIKNDFVQIFNKNLQNIIENSENIKSLFKKYPITYVILRTEYDPLDLIVINQAKKLKIKTGILQHALYYDDLQNLNYYNFKSGQFHREFPIYSDHFLTWGKLTQLDSKNHGVPAQKIVSIGCPFFDIFSNNIKSSKTLEEQYILLAATPQTPKNLTKELSVKTQIEYYETIKQICEITTKINKDLVIKLHHGSISNEKKIINKINPNIDVETSGSFYQYAKKCEILICIDSTTAILEAMLLKKPVILVLINDRVAYPELFKNENLIIATISELENVLLKLIHDSSFKNSVIKNGESFLNYYLDNIGTSSNTLLNFLDKVEVNKD